MNMFDKVENDSIRPFEAECIVGVKPHRGIEHKFVKPVGSYHLYNPEAFANIRQRKVDEFLALCEAPAVTERYFSVLFSNDVWEEAPAESEVRTTVPCSMRMARSGGGRGGGKRGRHSSSF